MLGLLDLRDDPSLFLGVDRLQRTEEIEARFIAKLKQRTAQEWFAFASFGHIASLETATTIQP